MIGGPDGAVLRPVTFAERAAIVAAASAERSPIDALAAGLLAASTVRSGVGDPTVLEVAALALAAVAELDGPGRDSAGPYSDDAFDEVASAEAPSASADGWTRIVFADASTPAGLEATRAALAEQTPRRPGRGRVGCERPKPRSARALEGGAWARDFNCLAGAFDVARSFAPDLSNTEAARDSGRTEERAAPPTSADDRGDARVVAYPFRMRLGREPAEEVAAVTTVARRRRASGDDPPAMPSEATAAPAASPATTVPAPFSELASVPRVAPRAHAARSAVATSPSRTFEAVPYVLPAPREAGSGLSRDPDPDMAFPPGLGRRYVLERSVLDRPAPPPSPSAFDRWSSQPEATLDPARMADEIARLLDDEADLRGIDR